MKKMKIVNTKNVYTLFAVVLALFLSGCYTDTVTPNELVGYQKKMVVNAIFTAGEPLALELTTSEAAISSELPDPILDATVSLTRVGSSESMTYDIFEEKYTTASTLSSSESINIQVQHPDFLNISSTIRLPDAINATGNYLEDGIIDSSGFPADLLQVTFQDQAGLQNYYKLNVDYFNQTLGIWVPLAFDKSDPSLSAYSSFILDDAGVLFTDELFNGREKTISTIGPGGLVSGNSGDRYRMVISSISKDFYKYISSLERARDAREVSFDGGYNNAVVIHSNVDGGVGIIGAEARTNVILR